MNEHRPSATFLVSEPALILRQAQDERAVGPADHTNRRCPFGRAGDPLNAAQPQGGPGGLKPGWGALAKGSGTPEDPTRARARTHSPSQIAADGGRWLGAAGALTSDNDAPPSAALPLLGHRPRAATTLRSLSF